MGTRADFYVGRGIKSEWLGSIAWDGYPSGLPKKLLKQTTVKGYRKAVSDFLASRQDSTLPVDGWPWPWEDSQTTDYAYSFYRGKVYASPFGHGWYIATEPEPDEEENPDYFKKKVAVFPNMKEIMNVQLGKKSGLIIVTGPK